MLDEKTFNENFFQVNKYMPQKGQVIARFRTMATMLDGPDKRNMVNALMKKGKIEPAIQTAIKVFNATEEYALKSCLEIVNDLLSGMNVEDVCKKEYSYLLEILYYANPQYVPTDSPHWDIIELKFADEKEGGNL